MPFNLTASQRFFAKIDFAGPIPQHCPALGGCWIWKERLNPYGYGQFHDGKTYYAHRYMYQLLGGVVPDDLTIDHLCRIRHCVNPDHFDVVSRKINVLRGIGVAAVNARKTHCIHGHPLSGLNLRLQVRRRKGKPRTIRVCVRCDSAPRRR